MILTSFEKMDESRPGEEAILNPKNYLQTDFFVFSAVPCAFVFFIF
jgi:hypothetical protein